MAFVTWPNDAADYREGPDLETLRPALSGRQVKALDQGQEPEASRFRSRAKRPFVNKKDAPPNRPSAGHFTVLVEQPLVCQTVKVVRLFQRVVDRSEHVVEVGAQAIHSNDDSDRDAGRDKTVFDGCGT